MPGRSLEDLIRDLLDEGRAGPPPESLGTEFLALRVRPTASRLYDLLGRSPTEAAKRNIPVLLAQLAARDDRWARVVKSSLRAQGRCPRSLRAILRGASSHGGPVASAPLSSA